jgi:glycosyltransferase involved in cell wall biosynthesis
MDRITWHPSSIDKKKVKYSIIIPTWNNLSFLKTCIKSILKNSHFDHQIIVHVNAGYDGTLDWVKEKGLDYTHSIANIGVCHACNACRTLVKTEYIVYFNDDMYALPDWDLEIWQEIERLPDKYFFISATMIEPKPSPHLGILAPYNYGDVPENFQEEKLLGEYKSLPGYDWNGATWPPNIVHKDIWDLVGGYSIEYFPGMYSDPDFSMKLLKSGVTFFKGVGKSMVYHFGSKSTQRIKKNHGSKQFLNKWGITSSTLTSILLKRGTKFTGNINPHFQDSNYRLAKIRSKLKRIGWSFTPTGELDEL